MKGIRILKTGRDQLKPLQFCLISGFTLLEVMVSLAIIATVLISVYKLHAQSLALAHETHFYGLAPFLAQQKMAELALGETDIPENGTGDFGEDFPNFRWKVDVESMESGFEEKKEIVFARIDLTIFNDANPFSYQLRTYRLASF